ncbi:hypothetical protein DUT91_21260 [Phyllobacterium salinisoli]|uniref:Uncharacterized protein n=1 Tax=Phyllobacterium salinisoli TaxID=1899321 RepID=A0A368JXQ2_9HYPH|nr:hypothetical protein [Phyllobacterium salinisoli]RCS21938.1 hypothetical protein DUT91_21260 [Phyllobacterium salinisoli]
MKSQDIVVLLKLMSLEDDEKMRVQLPAGHSPPAGEDAYSVRGLEAALGISKTEISASINRSLSSGIAIKDRKTGRPKPNRRQLREFIVHGLKFVFPAKLGAMQRGLPTAFAAPVLRGSLHSAGSLISVWPYARGHEMGQSVEPLFKSVPEAAEKDERLYAYLALIDAVRLGNQREANLAANLLQERFG